MNRFIHNRQSGAALVVSLLILLVMTLIGVSSMQTTTMEEKMASNTRERQQAFEAAEAALRAAELHIFNNVSLTNSFDTNGTDGHYDNSVQELWRTLSWTPNTDCKPYTGYNTYGTTTVQAPCYIIEHYGSFNSEIDQYNLGGYGTNAGGGDVEMFRITVRGTGPNSQAPVFLQSYYGKIL
jgi:type IV pilus assembly protein PilX